ncbi:hypothetical protein Dimus_037000, partial [Dionaea muscipula]
FPFVLVFSDSISVSCIFIDSLLPSSILRSSESSVPLDSFLPQVSLGFVWLPASMADREIGVSVGDSSSGDDLGDEGGRFHGLSDSIEVRRIRLGELVSSGVAGGSSVSEVCQSGLVPVSAMAGGEGSSGDALLRSGEAFGDGLLDVPSPMMVSGVSPKMENVGLVYPQGEGGVAVRGLDGAVRLVPGYVSATVTGRDPLFRCVSSSDGNGITGLTPPCDVADAEPVVPRPVFIRFAEQFFLRRSGSSLTDRVVLGEVARG